MIMSTKAKGIRTLDRWKENEENLIFFFKNEKGYYEEGADQLFPTVTEGRTNKKKDALWRTNRTSWGSLLKYSAP